MRAVFTYICECQINLGSLLLFFCMGDNMLKYTKSQLTTDVDVEFVFRAIYAFYFVGFARGKFIFDKMMQMIAFVSISARMIDTRWGRFGIVAYITLFVFICFFFTSNITLSVIVFMCERVVCSNAVQYECVNRTVCLKCVCVRM